MYIRLYYRSPIQPKLLYDLKFKEQVASNSGNFNGEHLSNIAIAFLYNGRVLFKSFWFFKKMRVYLYKQFLMIKKRKICSFLYTSEYLLILFYCIIFLKKSQRTFATLKVFSCGYNLQSKWCKILVRIHLFYISLK